jgi:hypothetical protein
MSTDPHTQLAREPLDDLVRWLDRTVVVAAVLAAAGLLVPGRAGDDVAGAAVAVVVAAPLLRVVWLEVAWARTGDRRFVAVGAVLLLVIATGTVLALLSA